MVQRYWNSGPSVFASGDLLDSSVDPREFLPAKSLQKKSILRPPHPPGRCSDVALQGAARLEASPWPLVVSNPGRMDRQLCSFVYEFLRFLGVGRPQGLSVRLDIRNLRGRIFDPTGALMRSLRVGTWTRWSTAQDCKASVRSSRQGRHNSRFNSPKLQQALRVGHRRLIIHKHTCYGQREAVRAQGAQALTAALKLTTSGTARPLSTEPTLHAKESVLGIQT